jgi:hypothetical protein
LASSQCLVGAGTPFLLPMMHVACLAVASLVAVYADRSELREAARARQMSLEKEWSRELEAQAPRQVAYQSPIKRVVSLLNKMKAELEHEAKNEAEMYDKMVCWCETNDKEKTKAIKDADAKDTQLTSEIESRAAAFGTLSTQIKTTQTEVSDLKKALAEATSIRETAATKFASEEKSLTQALTNVKNAIIILSKHQSFLQVNAPLMLGIKTVLRDLAYKHELLTDHDASIRRSAGLRGAFIAIESSSERASAHEATRMSRDLLNAMDVKAAGNDESLPLLYAERLVSQSAAASTPAAPSFLQVEKPPGYSSASGAVFGMLEQLQTDFKAAMALAQKDEKKESDDFVELSAAKNAQIDATSEKLDDLQDEDSGNSKALSDAKEDLEMTREQRSADAKFLANLKTTCQGLDQQWAARSKTRSDELKAVSEAAAIINDDDNMDLMRNSVTFLQVFRAKKTDARRAKAVDIIKDGLDSMFDGADDLLNAWDGRHSSKSASLGASLHSSKTQLAALAITVQLDTFTKVKEAMDKLVATLKAQQSEEVDFNAKCVKDFNANEKATFQKTDAKEDQQAAIQALETKLTQLAKEGAEAKTQISETETAIKKAGQDRESENAAYQSVVADQRATQDILKKAVAKLKGFYERKKAAALIQMEGVQTPPVQFNTQKDNAGASPVIGMITQIIEDSAKLETESVADEKKAQAEYESFVKDSNTLLTTLGNQVIANTKSSADAKGKLAETKGDLQNSNNELDGLAKVEKDLHSECDFVQKNFEIRQKARLTEMEAIQSAKGVLSGAK